MTPLVAVTDAVPKTAQFAANEVVLLVIAIPLFAIVTEFVPEHPFASVIVTV